MSKSLRSVILLSILWGWGDQANSKELKKIHSHAQCIREIKDGYQLPYDRDTLHKISLSYRRTCMKMEHHVDWVTLCDKRIEFSRRVGRKIEAGVIKNYCSRFSNTNKVDDPTKEECKVRACWKERGAFVCQVDSTATGYFGIKACRKNGIVSQCLKKIGGSVKRYPRSIEWSVGSDKGTAICRALWQVDN